MMTKETEAGTITVNGRPCALPAQPVSELLGALGHDRSRTGIAVAINDEVVPRSQWAERRVLPGDRVEIVGAEQGG